MKTYQVKLFVVFLMLLITGQSGSAADNGQTNLDAEMVDHGRYIAKIAGCNDCHTAGYLAADGNLPVEQWLLGDIFGWYGPWGTTYGSNVRLFIAEMSEDQWVASAKSMKRLPPMPWFSLNAMTEYDLRALYQFMKSLGGPGEPAPDYLSPGQKPNPPYAQFPLPPE
jgi:mono/diheme cytochrome c family protein